MRIQFDAPPPSKFFQIPGFLLFPLLTLFFSLIGSGQQPVQVVFDELQQIYDGNPKFPQVSTNPPGLQVQLSLTPHRQAASVFHSIPEVLPPSLPSHAIEGRSDHGLGDLIEVGGSNRRLSSVEVVMVNWAEAADWPEWAAENGEGYQHEMTITLYEFSSLGLFTLTRQTRNFLVPWRPSELEGGGEYPFNGIAFPVRFDFAEEVILSERMALVVTYNTSSSGPEPLGVEGPYDQLNVGLSEAPPSVGGDVDAERVLRITGDGFGLSNFDGLNPLFRLRAFPPQLSVGTPVDAGSYRLIATVTESGYTGEASATFEILPAPVDLRLRGLRQVADGSAKTVSVETDPSDLPFEVVFAERSDPPTERGLYPVFASLVPGNYTGSSSGLMRLGYSFDSWIAEQVADGAIPAAQSGPSDDPDRDSFSNFMEYSAASPPGEPGDGAALVAITGGGGGNPVFSFRRHYDAIDLTYEIESSRTPEDATSWEPRGELVLPNEPLPLLERVEIPLAIESGITRFLRLKVTTRDPID